MHLVVIAVKTRVIRGLLTLHLVHAPLLKTSVGYGSIQGLPIAVCIYFKVKILKGQQDLKRSLCMQPSCTEDKSY